METPKDPNQMDIDQDFDYVSDLEVLKRTGKLKEVDYRRALVSHLSVRRERLNISGVGYERLMMDHLVAYSNEVDEESQGVDNYASQALRMGRGKEMAANAIQWRSTLSSFSQDQLVATFNLKPNNSRAAEDNPMVEVPNRKVLKEAKKMVTFARTEQDRCGGDVTTSTYFHSKRLTRPFLSSNKGPAECSKQRLITDFTFQKKDEVSQREDRHSLKRALTASSGSCGPSSLSSKRHNPIDPDARYVPRNVNPIPISVSSCRGFAAPSFANPLRSRDNFSGTNEPALTTGESIFKKPEKPGPLLNASLGFRSAREQHVVNEKSKGRTASFNTNGPAGKGQGVNAPYVCPLKKDGTEKTINIPEEYLSILDNERLKNLDSLLIEKIINEIVNRVQNVKWEDIAGLEVAKRNIREIVILPMLRPDLFTGLRAPTKGLLLFGPPGTGKTLIGKCIASQSKSTFFNISASSLTSKWIGEGEKMVRTMFAVARCLQPAVIFIDEIDSLLTQRCDTDHESSRRIKTEFLLQFDGMGSEEEERLLIIGATNRPQELDEAARRRFVKRIYIPLPGKEARSCIIKNLIKTEAHALTPEQTDSLAEKTEGYSGADMSSLCTEASYGPIRSVDDIMTTEKLRPINFDDFEKALEQVTPSVAPKEIVHYEEFNAGYGAGTK